MMRWYQPPEIDAAVVAMPEWLRAQAMSRNAGAHRTSGQPTAAPLELEPGRSALDDEHFQETIARLVREAPAGERSEPSRRELGYAWAAFSNNCWELMQ